MCGTGGGAKPRKGVTNPAVQLGADLCRMEVNRCVVYMHVLEEWMQQGTDLCGMQAWRNAACKRVPGRASKV
eukprot:1161979-Pelagomonas_calceolata.AAC.4